MVPKKVFFTKGVGKHRNELQSFELALRNAGIEKSNLVNVSSIVPPNCKIITKEIGVNQLEHGQITYCVMSRNSTNEPNRLLGASIGVAIPREKMGDYAEDLAASMLATTLGLDFDPDKAWDERKQEYKMSGRFVRTQSITQTAKGDKNGLWTTVLAVAVFLEE